VRRLFGEGEEKGKRVFGVGEGEEEGGLGELSRYFLWLARGRIVVSRVRESGWAGERGIIDRGRGEKQGGGMVGAEERWKVAGKRVEGEEKEEERRGTRERSGRRGREGLGVAGLEKSIGKMALRVDDGFRKAEGRCTGS